MNCGRSFYKYKVIGEWGITGSLESILEITFFIPAFLYWRREDNMTN